MDVRLERFLLLSLVLILGGLLSAVPCGAASVRAFVSILPQAYFVERIGGDHVQVDVLVGPGQSPATYEPTPREIAALEKADVYFRIGTPFENAFVEKIARILPGLRIVDTRRGVKLRFFRGEGERQVPDPHIWLDPMRVKTQARTICDALSDLAPGLSGAFEDNLRAFHRDLDALDERLRNVLAPLRSRKILVFHPAFGYFCDAYGLEQIAVETEGKAPGPKRLADLIDMAREEEIRIIFVQPQYSKKSAGTIAEAISGTVIPLDPLARDYLDNLRRMAEAVREGLTSP
ncbi:MAG: zinc ABC transporter substrate-binding protein [Deltaproteobacteria bacterium]|nr:zinc ABC transporter substrate-binding protein [Deltaproteobacteria bacterium]